MTAVRVPDIISDISGLDALLARAGNFLGLTPFTTRNLWTGPTGGPSLTYSDGVITNGTYKTHHVVCYDATHIRLLYTNCGNEIATGNDDVEAPPFLSTDPSAAITVKSKLNYNGIEFPVYFSGRRQVTIDPGGMVLSDPVSIDVRVATAVGLDVYTYVSIAAGKKWPLGIQVNQQSPYSEGYSDGVDATDIGVAWPGGFKANLYHPWMLLGVTNPRHRPVVVIVGDSIITGYFAATLNGVPQSGVTNDYGYVDLALNDTIPTVKVSRGGGTAQYFAVQRRAWYRHTMMSVGTHCVVGYGTNDVGNGRTIAQMQADLTTIWNYAKLLGMKVYACTLPPRTTSTDNFQSAANQSVMTNEANRTALNDWIRTVPAPLSGYFDVADAVEVNASNVLTRNGGYWLCDGTTKKYTVDGIHPSYDGHRLIKNAVNASVFTV